ncbi:phosphotransferase [Arthrobacter sp. USHLN218]|uniref:phosphotransferase n=1 Tax=Arthrobacter sp. USHLN218 TaxID=3081232 RepID=UPI003019CE65
MELAALASAAVPGLSPAGVVSAPDDAADFTSAVVIDDAGKQWRVRSPKHAEASMRLETELLVLRSFSPGIRAELSFQVPSIAGTVQRGELRTFVYNHVPGTTLDLEALVAEGGGLPMEIGRAMAGIHDLPQSMVDRADLPSYTADEFRTRRLNELDQAATTGKIPSALLRRWEHALEDVTLWKFNPCVVHGDLHEDNLQISEGLVTSVTGWTDLRIGDPADDFAWLIAVHEQSFADVVLETYNKYRTEAVDPHLMRRAALAAEFALAQWLVRGVAADDPDMIAEAEEMLKELEADIREYGGQPISVELPPAPVVVSPVPAADRPTAPGTGGVPAPPAARPGGGRAADGRSGENDSPDDGDDAHAHDVGGASVVLIRDAAGDRGSRPPVVVGGAAGSGPDGSVVVVEGAVAAGSAPAQDDESGRDGAGRQGPDRYGAADGASSAEHRRGADEPAADGDVSRLRTAAGETPNPEAAATRGLPPAGGPEAPTTAIPVIEPRPRT